MRRATEYLKTLSQRFPHRHSTSEMERQAAGWLADELRSTGCDVRVEAFRAPSATLYTGPSTVGLALTVLVVLVRWFGLPPLAGMGLALVSLLPLVGEVLGWTLNLDAISLLRPSQNVVTEPSLLPDDRQRVVLTAHYDTQLASPLFSPGFRPFIQPFFTVAYVGFFGVPVTLALLWAWPHSVIVSVVLYVVSAIALAASAFLLTCWGLGHPIHGANDNGSGTAVVLATAARFKDEPVPGVDLQVVFTGAEEVGTRGMIAFLREYDALLPGDTVFINVDNVGGGTLRYLTAEGLLVPVEYDEGLLSLARELAQSGAYGEVAPKNNLLLPTDGLIPRLRGYRALTLISFASDDRIPHYHWYSDTLENVDPELVDSSADFLWALLQALPQHESLSS